MCRNNTCATNVFQFHKKKVGWDWIVFRQTIDAYYPIDYACSMYKFIVTL